MKKIQGAKSVIKSLEKEGVELVFGYPGGAVLGLYDALLDSNIKHILTRHEQGAAHAASGYARASGKVGVCIATSGPGATNLVTGIATAFMDSIPIVAITGQVSTQMIGKDVFQEVDITGATAPFTKHNYLVKDAEDLPRIIKEAFHIASTGRPGPVLIDIPKDIAGKEINNDYPKKVSLRGYKPNYDGHPLQIKRALKEISKSERPIICSGGGVISSNASTELIEFAEKHQIPVVNTLMGIGSIPNSHYLSLGMLGMHGTPYANKAIPESDLMIAIGARFDDRVVGKVTEFAPDSKIIHIDIDPAEIGKNIGVHIPIVGDIKRIMKELLKKDIQVKERNEWLKRIKDLKDNNPLKYEAEGSLKPQYVLEELSKLTNGNAVLTTDVGQHQMWSALFYGFSKPRSFLVSGGLGTMGYGLPAAIGAQFAKPEEVVIAITGDGSFQMNLNELATIAENKLPIKVILFNNQSLALVKQLQKFYCNKRYSQVEFKMSPDFIKISEGYGINGFRIKNKSEVSYVLNEALSIKGPAVVEVQLDTYEDVYPMVLNGSPINDMIGG